MTNFERLSKNKQALAESLVGIQSYKFAGIAYLDYLDHDGVEYDTKEEAIQSNLEWLDSESE